MVRVLYSEQVEDKVGLLIGRDIGSRVGLQLDLATGTVSRSRRGLCAERRQVEDDSAEAIDVIRYVHDSVMRYIDKPGGGRGVGTQPSPQEEGKVIYPVLPRQEQEVARKVIATLVDKGELVVEGLPDYRLSFRRLEEHSQRDCEGQEVAVFIDLPKKGDEETTELRIPRYERAAYSKLEEAHRAVYRKLVQEFVDRGWWVKKSELQVEGHPEGKECLPASPIFLAQLEKKPRLVLDCRGVNQSLGGVSSSRRATSDVLIAVRLNGGDLIVADLQKAYYRCRLVDRWVLLATAIGEFVSDRVVFGLHFGAGCLQGAVKEIIMTMLELMKGLSEEQILLFILYYMDDIVIQEAEVEGIVRAFALLFAILRILGFVAQCDKLWAVVRPGNEEQFRQYCEGYGVVVPLSTEGTLLGVGVCMEQERMLLDCRLAQRWSAVAEFLNSTTWTKSSTFACAGVLAHDSVQGHPTLRLIGDVLRAIVGKTFSSWTWDRPFTIDNFGDGVRTAFEEIGKWISEKKPAQECVHASSLRLESESIFLTLETDSSLLGWGFSLWATRQEGVAEFCSEAEGKCFEILGAAGRWTNREAAWHSNRRELRAMFEGVSRTARLLDYWRGSHHRLGTQGTCRLSIKGDNFASIRWCNENPPCKALELRSIVRLADAIKAEISFIRNSCDVTVDITHLQGSLNTRADSLSRLLERRCANGIQIGRVLQEHLDEPLKVATVIDDIISRIGEIPSYPDELEDRLCYIPDEVSSEYRKHTGSPSLADELSLRSYDVNAALNAWKALRFAFTWWKQSTGDLPTAELQYPDTYLEEDKASFARSLQMGWAEGMDAKALRSLACIRIDDAGIARYLVNSANGSTSWAYYVPKKRMAFKRLLIRSAHRKLRHASRNASVERAIEFGFFAPSLRRLANDELAVCVTCQLKNAKREWRILPGLSGAGISDLSPDNLLRAGKEPFYAVSVDAITLGSGLLYLSVVCLMTYSVVWIAIPDQTSPSIAAGIRRAMRREGGCAGKCTLSTCVEPRCDFC